MYNNVYKGNALSNRHNNEYKFETLFKSKYSPGGLGCLVKIISNINLACDKCLVLSLTFRREKNPKPVTCRLRLHSA